MVDIYAQPGVHLALGRKGENEARRVIFNLTAWRAAHGDGAVSLCAKRAGDAEPYPCGVTQDEDTAVWVLRAADVDKPGWGDVQLSYYVGDVLAKSQTWRTLVAPSLCACGDPGEAQQGWLDQAGKDAAAAQQGAKDAQEAQKAAEDAAEAAKSSASAASGSSDSAGKSAQAAAASASAAAGSATNAGASESAAKSYAKAAANAAASASSSQTAAASSASSADGSASAAADSAKTAKDAQGKAEEAEAAAAAAKTDAEAAASAAKDATEHPPIINDATQTWLTWQDGEYVDTGLPIAIDGSLPPGAAAYQQLATDGNGNVVWRDRIGYEKDPAPQTLIGETTVETSTSDGYTYGNFPASGVLLEEGRMYFVTFDGAEYECVGKMAWDFVYLGNSGAGDATKDDEETGEPFSIWIFEDEDGELYTTEAGTHTLAVSALVADVVKIPEKYLDKETICELVGNLADAEMDTELGLVSEAMIKNIDYEAYHRESYAYNPTLGSYANLLHKAGEALPVGVDYNTTTGLKGSFKILHGEYRISDETAYVTACSDNRILCYKAFAVYGRAKVWEISPDGIILPSSTEGSTKQFRITVDDTGTLSATEITT